MQVEVSNQFMNKHANTTIQKASQRQRLCRDDLWNLKSTKKNIIAEKNFKEVTYKNYT